MNVRVSPKLMELQEAAKIEPSRRSLHTSLATLLLGSVLVALFLVFTVAT